MAELPSEATAASTRKFYRTISANACLILRQCCFFYAKLRIPPEVPVFASRYLTPRMLITSPSPPVLPHQVRTS
jgi:hypothetical protein